MSGLGYRRAGALLMMLIGLTALLLSGIASADYTPGDINKECAACDANVLSAINTYQSNFGKFNKAVDGAKFHCARFAKLRTCYTDCLHGTYYTYASSMKSLFDNFYAGTCDPACYLAVLPYCYTSTIGSYDMTKSCDGENMHQGLKACVQTELFVNQNCTGVCTQGQRKALFYFFSTMFQCTIPYQTANDCYTWSLYCTEAAFGYNGAAYVSYSNETIIASNRLGCSSYAGAFLDCVQQAIDDDVVLGNPPYAATYKSPCADLTTQLKFLADFGFTMLVGPFCENPNQSFNDTCQAYAAPTTTTTTTTTTQRPSITAATAKTAPPVASTNVATAPSAATALPTTPAPEQTAGNAPSTAPSAVVTAGSAGSQQSAVQQSSTTSSSPAPLPPAGGTTSAAGGQPTGVAVGPTSGTSSSAAPKPISTTRSVPSTKPPHRLVTTPSDGAVAVPPRAAVVLLACAAAGLWAHFGFN